MNIFNPKQEQRESVVIENIFNLRSAVERQ